MKFYSTKVICIELGISEVSLRSRINRGFYPALEKSLIRKNGVGYFEEKMAYVMSVVTPKSGRPKKQ